MFTKKDTLSTNLSTVIPQKRSIIVIIVHFGSNDATTNLIQAVLHGTRLPDQLIVVDHDPLAYTYDDVRVMCIRPPSNNGYIAGLRFGVQESSASAHSMLVLMNNDSMITDDFLGDIERWWNDHGGNNILAGPRIGTVSRLSGKASLEPGYHSHISRPLTYIDGACMVVERAFFERISTYEQLFMYWEDVAVSWHAQAIGGRLKKIPNLGFTHENASSAVSEKKLYYLVRNGACILEHLSFPWGRYWAVKNVARLMWHTMLPGARHKIIVRALKDSSGIL